MAMVDGNLEITMSQWIKDIINDIAASVPACPMLKTRREWDHRRHQYLESRAPPDPGYVRLRSNRIHAGVRANSRVMDAANRLNSQLAEVSGSDAAALYRAGQMESFADEQVALDLMETYEAEVAVLPEAAEATEILAGVERQAMGAASALAFFAGAADIITPMWKLKADPEPMPIFTKTCPGSQPGTCDKEEKACAGERCQGGPDGKCTKEWAGCNCITSSLSIPHNYASEWEAIEDTIFQFVVAPPPKKDVPNAMCDGGDQGTNIARVESSTWSRYATIAPLFIDENHNHELLVFTLLTCTDIDAEWLTSCVRTRRPSRNDYDD